MANATEKEKYIYTASHYWKKRNWYFCQKIKSQEKWNTTPWNNA